jgi:hypothetical protein
MKVNLGSNIIDNCDAALVVNGTEVFWLRNRESDGRLISDFDVRDKSGNRIAKVSKNNVVYNAEGYEVHHLPRESFIRDSKGRILIRVQEIGIDEIRISGEFWIDGYQVLITDNSLISGGITMSGNIVRGFGKAISIEPNRFSIGVS